MCDFLSLVSDGKVGSSDGKLLYFDWKLRKKCLNQELKYNPDSHTSIADYFGYKDKREDGLNKYEYNPITKKFTVNQLNTTDDSKEVKKKCLNLDFKLIVPDLIVKEIIHPLSKKPPKITQKQINLLNVWDSVGDSVRYSVRDSVRDSVRYSVRYSVRDSVWDSVGDSVWDSVWAYIGTFFSISSWKYIDHKKGQYPFKAGVELWEMGLVPSFDGRTWRLHGNKNADILFKITQKELRNLK